MGCGWRANTNLQAMASQNMFFRIAIKFTWGFRRVEGDVLPISRGQELNTTGEGEYACFPMRVAEGEATKHKES
eukprot:7961662-Pyramimonas_sp.AAC.2